MPRELIFDTWTPLTFKRQFGPRRVPGSGWAAPTWVGDDHQRRLLAYKVLQSFLDNAAREFIATTDDDRKNEHREYGDAAVLRNAALSALLGDEQVITVDGAGEADVVDGSGAAEEAEASAADQQLEYLEQWADDERLAVKVQEVERTAVGLGDGVYVLGWSNAKGRPRLRVYDPGFYFPVLDNDANDDEFPTKVHIAWEYEDDNEPGKKFVRRMTWELVPLADLEEADPPVRFRGDVAERDVAYQDDPVTHTCLYTDATWELKGNVSDVDDLTPEKATYLTNDDGEMLNRFDLGIDFVPVIHISNTVAVQEHFGQSVIATIAQILDDLANSDTDLAAAAGTTGAPPIAISGHSATGTLRYKPGTVFGLGDGGRMDVLDTSKSLDALLKYVDSLLQRLSVNGRLPAALLGRIDASDVPSGVALALSFGPLSAMVREMRLARKEKYRLLFKFVHRLGLIGEVEGLPREHATTDYTFGSFLPNDEAAAVQMVTRLLEAKAISLEQAVNILRAAGITDRDAEDEVKAIQSRMFAAANELFDATGDQAAVFEFLGITPSADAAGGTEGTGGRTSAAQRTAGELEDDDDLDDDGELPPVPAV